MITFPFDLTLDVSSLLAGISLAAVTGWIASLFALRKDERAVYVDQVTKERAKWRDNMRKVTEEISQAFHDNKATAVPGKVAALRGRLVTSINPKDDKHDDQILAHFDELFAGRESDLDVFTKRIALLLKHDWERVKWDCMPIYEKVCNRFSKKQREWRNAEYRKIDG